MTTNRDMLMERFSQMTDEELADQLHDNVGQCGRCSNRYWDGNVGYCHCNLNRSSCIQGQAEWLAACPNDNLQLKYKKKYDVFPDYQTMLLGVRLTRILQDEELIDYSDKERCRTCSHPQLCVMFNGPEQEAICQYVWINLNTMSRKYGRKLIEALPEYKRDSGEAHDIEDKYINTGARCWNYLRDVLIPCIKDDAYRAEATELMASIDAALERRKRGE